MGLLSNLLGFKHERGDAAPAVVQRATEDQIESALRLILAPPGQGIDPQIVRDFIDNSKARGVAFDGLHIAQRGGKLTSAILPVISPGKTMLLLCSPAIGKSDDQALGELIETICAWGRPAVYLAQTLVDPQDTALERILLDHGFARMAELHYLQVSPPLDATFPQLPPGMQWLKYSLETHPLFGEVILESYQQSLDCPALNGQRTIDDIIAGHKATGSFDPNLWLLLREGNRSLGVLLLSPSHRSDAVELVYLGLSPQARGRKLGELMMKQALATVAALKQPRLCLAVDALNTPALKLYYRHGMHRAGSKLAMLRDLRGAP